MSKNVAPRSLDERLVPLIQAAIERNTSTGIADLPTSLRDMGTRADA